MIRHMVFLKYPDSVSQQTRTQIIKDLDALRSVIDGIQDFQYRDNVSPEAPVIHGFREMFWFDFDNAQVRDNYLDDENHRAIGARIVAATEGGVNGVFVCDIEI